MLQKSQTTTWDGAKTTVDDGKKNYRSLNWWLYQISSFHQQYHQIILGLVATFTHILLETSSVCQAAEDCGVDVYLNKTM